MKILLTFVKPELLLCLCHKLWTTLHCGGKFASNSQINRYRKNIKINIFELFLRLLLGPHWWQRVCIKLTSISCTSAPTCLPQLSSRSSQLKQMFQQFTSGIIILNIANNTTGPGVEFFCFLEYSNTINNSKFNFVMFVLVRNI